jgi:hypothetical protein
MVSYLGDSTLGFFSTGFQLMQNEDLSHQIIGAAMEVHRTSCRPIASVILFVL